MKRILVPLGNIENSVDTLQYAIDLASVSNSRIYVIQVFGSVKTTGILKKVDDIIESEAKEELRRILENVDKKNVEIISKVFKGEISNVIQIVSKALDVDLIVSSANYTSPDSSVYIGPVVGEIVKRMEFPVLIIPKGYQFKPYKTILLGVRSGLIKRGGVLDPLHDLVSIFKSKVNLLHVITSNNKEKDNILHKDFNAIADSVIKTENATVYQGVLKHLNDVNPDLLCVIRRKRGFFSKLWEKKRIKKIDFESRIPLLVLRGNL
ncbi:universal stress protein [Lutibacter citreus]|uniref:universal stress protein n=1 Tax=Lutibacter citreus TaxID=2138210 RepID=UPI000DBE5453|nr:universal stress protein [Lutibacter citreus]